MYERGETSYLNNLLNTQGSKYRFNLQLLTCKKEKQYEKKLYIMISIVLILCSILSIQILVLNTWYKIYSFWRYSLNSHVLKQRQKRIRTHINISKTQAHPFKCNCRYSSFLLNSELRTQISFVWQKFKVWCTQALFHSIT